jgi:RimJ/RimL family protein N-acetyltransferase
MRVSIMYNTDRLTIRKFLIEDLAPLRDLFSSDDAMRFIGPRRPMTTVEIQNWLRRQIDIQLNEVTRNAVVLKKSDELIGICGFQRIGDVWDFGYYFRPAFWGNGYATEACSCLLQHAESILGGKPFIVFVAEDNVSSQRVIERCGWRRGERTKKNNEIGYYYR